MQRNLSNLIVNCSRLSKNREIYRQSIRYLATVKEIFQNKSEFPTRHIGPRKTDVVSMLDLLGFKVKFCSLKLRHYIQILLFLQTLDELTDKVVPKKIKFDRDLHIEEPLSK
jgi:glycine dehydrogenase